MIVLTDRRGRPTTHCKRGHPWNEINTLITPKGDRHCRVCRREAQRKSTKPNLSKAPTARELAALRNLEAL